MSQKNNFKIFFLTFALLSCSVGLVLVFFFHLNTSHKKATLLLKEKQALQLQQRLSVEHFSRLLTDIHFLAGIDFSLGEHGDYARQKSLLLTFAQHKKIYDQLRYVDCSGMERVRVDGANAVFTLRVESKLQNKAHRYYVKEGMKLSYGTVYISPLDLNMENRKIDIPYKPMLRLVAPVVDENQKHCGLIILNYRAGQFLQLLKSAGGISNGDLTLVNDHGQFLMHANPDRAWSFMFPENPDDGAFVDDAEAWEEMKESTAGQFETEQGLYTYVRIDPFSGQNYDASGSLVEYERYWTLYSMIPADRLHEAVGLNSDAVKSIVISVVIILALISIIITYLISRRRYYRLRLQELAHYDQLTGLPNRVLLTEHLKMALDHIRRYDHVGSLLYIDLDGFKPVNDRFGHETGDMLLKAFANRLKSISRATDTVARIGGDEFIVLLSHVSGPDGVEVFAKKVLDSVKKPFDLNTVTVEIGTSIGISMMTSETKDFDLLFNNADQAMYRSKRSGKNKYSFYKSSQKAGGDEGPCDQGPCLPSSHRGR